jgi:hypothetical protein
MKQEYSFLTYKKKNNFFGHMSIKKKPYAYLQKRPSLEDGAYNTLTNCIV